MIRYVRSSRRAEVPHEVEHGGGGGDVEAAGRLVGDEELGVRARARVRCRCVAPVRRRARAGTSSPVQTRARPSASSSSTSIAARSSGTSLIRTAPSGGTPRVIRGLRLEYGSWKIICARRRKRRSSPRESSVIVRPSKTMLARRAAREPQDRAPERRLARAGLTDEAEHLAAAELQLDAVDRAHRLPVRAGRARGGSAARAAEVRREPLDAHQHSPAARSRGARRRRRRRA